MKFTRRTESGMITLKRQLPILLFLLVFLLSGCENDGMDPDKSDITETNGNESSHMPSDGYNPPSLEDDPIAKKFSEMSVVDTSSRTITVISEEYLTKMWVTDFYDGKIYSLSAEEVKYIIEDSVRIYSEYDTIILNHFFLNHTPEMCSQYPYIFEKTIRKSDQKSRHEDLQAIYDIIRYRLEALSSPDAFIGDVGSFNSGYWNNCFAHSDESAKEHIDARYYIPDYSENTDREALLAYFKGDMSLPAPDFDYFNIYRSYTPVIEFISKVGAKKHIFPSEIMTGDIISLQTETPKGDLFLTLDTLFHKFTLQLGTNILMKDMGQYSYDEKGLLILYGSHDATRYVFQADEKGSLKYISYASDPMSNLNITEDLTFEDDTNSLKESPTLTLPWDKDIETAAEWGYYDLPTEEYSAIDEIINCIRHWSSTPAHKDIKYNDWIFKANERYIEICACGELSCYDRITAVTRYCRLTDEEWSAIMRILKKYAPIANNAVTHSAF